LAFSVGAKALVSAGKGRKRPASRREGKTKIEKTAKKPLKPIESAPFFSISGANAQTAQQQKPRPGLF